MNETIIKVGFALLTGILLSNCTASSIPAQQSLPKRVTLASLRIHLASFDQRTFNSGDYAGLLVALREQGASAADLTQVHRSFNGRQNKIIQDGLDSLYKNIQAVFHQAGITLLDKHTLPARYGHYDPYGFPENSDLKTVADKTGADGVVAFHFYLHTQGIDIFKSGPYQTEIHYRPKLILTIKMTDNSGNLIWQDNATAIASSQVQLLERTNGIRTIEVRQEPSLPDMVTDAVRQLTNKLSSKKTNQ